MSKSRSRLHHGFRQPRGNFSNRPHPHAQNRGTILMCKAVWRVTEKPKIAIFGPGQNSPDLGQVRGTPVRGGRGGGGAYLTSGRGDGQKKRKKAPAASWLAATGLVKSQAVIFTEQNSACGKMVSSNRACQIQGWSFSPKKKRLRQDTYQQQGLSNPGVVIFTEESACGKIPSSNRACQSPDHGCIMDFDNCKVTFRTDHTPLHRIAVQF